MIEITSADDLPFSNRNCTVVTCELTGGHATQNKFSMVPGVPIFKDVPASQRNLMGVCPRVSALTPGFLKDNKMTDFLLLTKRNFVGISTTSVYEDEAQKFVSKRLVNVAIKGVMCLAYPNYLLNQLPIGATVGFLPNFSNTAGFKNLALAPVNDQFVCYPRMVAISKRLTTDYGIGIVVDHPRAKSQENWIKIKIF